MYTQVVLNCVKSSQSLTRDENPRFKLCCELPENRLWRPKVGKKGASLYAAISQHHSVNIRQISQNRAEQVGYYRFLENENVGLSELVSSLSDHCGQQVKDRHVLAINDSSEINLQSHAGRLKPDRLGVVGNNKDVGFFLHPTMVLDAESGFPLGLSHVQLWIREPGHQTKKERKYQNLPIEEKESFKWLSSAENSQYCLQSGGAKLVTHIGDRESDLYEAWASIPDGYNHLLVRVRQNRRLWNVTQTLYEFLSQQPVQGTYSVDVLADARINRKARSAWLSIRFAPVQIQRPENLSAKDYPDKLRLWVVEAREISPPDGQKPIHWRLMTTHPVESVEQALQVVLWYRWRWWIEQLFAALKRDGLDIESTQLESVEAIQRLTILGLGVALRTLQLVEGRDKPDLEATLAFTIQQQQCLLQLESQLEGKTKKQQNPYPKKCLPWATWIVARLGGWSGYQSQRPPGIVTLVKGLRRFESIFLGWNLPQP